MNPIEILSPPETVSMADEWFEFANSEHFWMQWRFQILRDELRRYHGELKNSLEIGCGHGVFRTQLEAEFGLTVDACDLNIKALERASPGRGRLLVYNIFDRLPEMEKAYDAIFLMDVIEHLDDDRAFLEAGLHPLKPGGLVVLNVPALMSLYSRYDRAAGHKRRYSLHEVRELFAVFSIEPVSLVYWGFSMLPLLWLRKLVLQFVPEENVIKSGFAAKAGLCNKLLHAAKNFETALPLQMPLGTSVLALGRLRQTLTAT